jgi:hypothetical protein
VLAWLILGLGVAAFLGGIGWYAAARKAEPDARRKMEAMGTLTFVGATVLIVLALNLFDDG